MANTNDPVYLQALTYTALEDRLNMASLISGNSLTGPKARQGFLPTRAPVYSNPSGMIVSVTPHVGVIENDFAAAAGDYWYNLVAADTVTLAASSPTQNRYDIVGVEIKDNFYDASGLNLGRLAKVQGANSAGTPSDPAIPSTFIPIVRCVVNATVTSPTFQDMRQYTASAGGAIPVNNVTERNAITSPTGNGVACIRLDKGWVEILHGGTWRCVGQVATAALADITDPYVGQTALLTTDLMVYRWTGSAWLGVQHTATGGGKSRYYRSSGTQSITSGTDTKVTFPTLLGSASADFTPNGSFDVFTVNRTGEVDIFAGVAWSSFSGEHAIWIGNDTMAARYANDGHQGNNGTAYSSVSTGRRFTAGDKISIGCYQGSGFGATILAGEMTYVRLDWTGP